ncbi:MAG: hypothetical protein EOP49_00380 [Sphingobacteriales bacterium]|nr:MAG: hypothetical protein EOP49_00380 [Sphingobacteriales bacterium]
MRLAILLLCCLLSGLVNGQEYRLNYDSTAIPELYQSVPVFLEVKQGDVYKEVKKYRLSTEKGKLDKRLNLTYTNEDLGQDGSISMLVMVGDRTLELPLRLPMLREVRFNLYADSIKPIMNYYINVEGVFSSGKIYPLTTDQVVLSSDRGTMKGNAWVAPAVRDFDRVTFTAASKYNPAIRATTTVYLQRLADPRDAENYQDGSISEPQRRRR